jgi:hypothetical protein
MGILKRSLVWLTLLGFVSASFAENSRIGGSAKNLRQLVKWEADFLGQVEGDPELQFPEGTDLSQKIQEAVEGKSENKEPGKEAKEEKTTEKKDSADQKEPEEKQGEKKDEKKTRKLTVADIKKFLKDPEAKKKLSEEEWKLLLGTLRANNAVLRKEGDFQTVMSKLLKEEFAGVQMNTLGGTGKIAVENDDIRKALNDLYKSKYGSNLFLKDEDGSLKKEVSAAELNKLFGENAILIDPALGAEFLGDTRLQALDIRGENFALSLEVDALKDLAFKLKIPIADLMPWSSRLGPKVGIAEANPQLPPAIRSLPAPQLPSEPLPPPRVSNAQPGGRSVKRIPGGSCPGGVCPSIPRGRQIQDPIPQPQESSQSGSGNTLQIPDGFFDPAPPITGKSEEDACLLKNLSKRKFSLSYNIGYADKTGQLQSNSTCQMTVHKKDTKFRAGGCTYFISTARHCVEPIRSERLEDGRKVAMELSNLEFTQLPGIEQVLSLSYDPRGADMAIMKAFAPGECADDNVVPVLEVNEASVSPETASVQENQGVILAGPRPILGRLSPSQGVADNAGSIKVDVRQEHINGELGITSGNSGGGAAICDAATGKLKWMGVISSGLKDPDSSPGDIVVNAPIGFLAEAGDKKWLREQMGMSAPGLAAESNGRRHAQAPQEEVGAELNHQ